MWATRAAALTVLFTLVAQSAANDAPQPNSLAKRCRACPLIVPECIACPGGQTCSISPQECMRCPTATCVADGGAGQQPVTSGISSFSLAPLPPGVTPTTVSPNQQSSPDAGVPSDTGTSKITANVPIPVTPGRSESAAVASKSSSSKASASSASASQAATQSSSTSAGLAAKNAGVPWLVEVGVAALGVLAL